MENVYYYETEPITCCTGGVVFQRFRYLRSIFNGFAQRTSRMKIIQTTLKFKMDL